MSASVHSNSSNNETSLQWTSCRGLLRLQNVTLLAAAASTAWKPPPATNAFAMKATPWWRADAKVGLNRILFKDAL